MDKEIKRRWVEVLRSGKYAQGKTKLFEAYKNVFCCLGVLCDIQGVPKEDIGAYSISPFDEDSGLKAFLPIRGLISQVEAGTLASMNDNGRDFDEIAAYIETNL